MFQTKFVRPRSFEFHNQLPLRSSQTTEMQACRKTQYSEFLALGEHFLNLY